MLRTKVDTQPWGGTLEFNLRCASHRLRIVCLAAGAQKRNEQRKQTCRNCRKNVAHRWFILACMVSFWRWYGRSSRFELKSQNATSHEHLKKCTRKASAKYRQHKTNTTPPHWLAADHRRSLRPLAYYLFPHHYLSLCFVFARTIEIVKN